MIGSGLYLVMTDPVAGYERCTEAAVAEGVPVVQLRMKDAPRDEVVRVGRRLRALVRGSATRLIVNDDPVAAAEIDADGVHLGQGDLPRLLALRQAQGERAFASARADPSTGSGGARAAVAEARRLLGPGKLVGLSTHDEDQAARAAALAPDYIGVGPIWATPTKRIPDPVLGLTRAARIARSAGVPAVGIGGIDAARLPAVRAAGLERFAVVRQVCGSPDPRAAIAELLAIWRG